MPEMTAMPILPVVLAPTNTAPAPGGRVALAEHARPSAPAQMASGPSIDASATQSDAADSFAQVLQKQLAQIPVQTEAVAAQAVDPTARLLPIDLLAVDAVSQPLSVAVLPVDPNAKPLVTDLLAVDAATQPLPDDALALESALESALDPAAVLTQGNNLPQPLAVDAVPLGPGTQLPSAAQGTAEPIKVTLPATATKPDLVAKGNELSASPDDDSKAAADAALTAQSPYLMGMVAHPVVKLDPGQPLAENSSAAESEATVQLSGATQSLVQSRLADSTVTTRTAEMAQATASTTAEFAAALNTATDAAPTRPEHDSAAADANYENLLAAAQAFHQGRAAGAHASGHATASLPVNTPVGARGWDDEVSNKLVWMIGRQEQRAELVLNPPQLGRVEVSLSMNAGQTNAVFVSANPAVRDALEAALPRLREMFADAGVTLGQAQVGADTGSNSLANQSTNQRENRDNSGRAMNLPDSAHALDNLRPPASTQWLRQSNGLVDVFA